MRPTFRGIAIRKHQSYKERVEVALTACEKLNIATPTLVDAMDDAVNTAYSAWPDRLYVIDLEGKIAVMGGPGPFGFPQSVTDAESWLKKKFPKN